MANIAWTIRGQKSGGSFVCAARKSGRILDVQWDGVFSLDLVRAVETFDSWFGPLAVCGPPYANVPR